jgi:hypothetical protein
MGVTDLIILFVVVLNNYLNYLLYISSPFFFVYSMIFFCVTKQILNYLFLINSSIIIKINKYACSFIGNDKKRKIQGGKFFL